MAKVQINSEKLTPFGGIFQSWSNLTPCYHLLLTQHWVIDAAVSSDTSTANYSFSDERVLLWRLMRGGCNIASDASSLVSSDLAHMQL